ncbi:MAG: dihydroorotase [Candidatus Margulisbacteria bacterium]|jgi:dihydroorotase|nr:dihydroorotase [Candidatus Margulisiibacteriota bacterium]
MSKLLLKNGIVVDPAQGLESRLDVLVENEKISALQAGLRAEDAEVWDLQGKYVTPGLIDMHVHLREPGQEEKETIKTGSKAAAAGGFTSIACMANTDPVADDVSIIKHIKEVAARNGLVHVLPIGACTLGLQGEHLTQIGEMQRFGAVAFSDDGQTIGNALVLRRVLEYAGMFGATVIAHCEDRTLVNGGSMNEGLLSTRLGLPGIPRAAETAMVARDIEMARNFGRIHLAHISARESLELIRQAKQQKAPVTCETAPHYLLLTEEAVGEYNTNAKMNPPLRTEADRQALLAALQDGTIDIIATDHAPHTLDNKRVEFNLAAFGIVGLETALPLLYTHLVKTRKIPLTRLIELMSVNPAKIFALDKGTLRPGSCADITVIDPELTKPVDKTKFYSKGRNTPFDGWPLCGWPDMTIVGGQVRYTQKAGVLVKKP